MTMSARERQLHQIIEQARAAREADLAAPTVEVGDVVIVPATGRRGDVVRISDKGGPTQRPIYHVRQRLGGRITLLHRHEFEIERRDR